MSPRAYTTSKPLDGTGRPESTDGQKEYNYCGMNAQDDMHMCILLLQKLQSANELHGPVQVRTSTYIQYTFIGSALPECSGPSYQKLSHIP